MKSTNPGTVLTLDAGGTTFSFSSVDSKKSPFDSFVIDSGSKDLKEYIDMIIEGFETLLNRIKEPLKSISFAFPGPADYQNGVIGDLANLPAFRGGVPLKSILEDHFKVPVYINNDANLFALGEACSGLLPEINNKLKEEGSGRRYKNLIGVTLGTGFGGGIVINGRMLVGDNSAGGEIWLMRQKNGIINAEEGVTIRAVKKKYAELTGVDIKETPSPLDICKIAEGEIQGEMDVARECFRSVGEILGDALANALTLIDGAVVIGGGLSGAFRYFLPTVISELNGTINGFSRLESKVFNLKDEIESENFYRSDSEKTIHPIYKKSFQYEKTKKIPLGISCLGTSSAVALGAYFYAMENLNK